MGFPSLISSNRMANVRKLEQLSMVVAVAGSFGSEAYLFWHNE